jgi:hypothetical protein
MNGSPLLKLTNTVKRPVSFHSPVTLMSSKLGWVLTRFPSLIIHQLRYVIGFSKLQKR